MHLAQSAEKEIAIHLPEAELQHFRTAANFTVSLNALPGKSYHGTLRELAAAADPATRTYAARIAVNNADTAMQLGMSATVEVQPAGCSGDPPAAVRRGQPRQPSLGMESGWRGQRPCDGYCP